MLEELGSVSQRDGEARRRWFTDAYFDLIVWYEDDALERVLGFQLCYDKAHDEHALTWKRAGGFTHHRIDDGQPDAVTHMAPILVPDGVVPALELRRRFTEACRDIDPAIARLVLDRLDELSGFTPHPAPR
jgi:hypothetical protein